MENTTISWAHHSFSGWSGCSAISSGVAGACKFCYAEAINKRFRDGRNWGVGAPRERTSEKYWELPLKWNRVAGKKKQRVRVFAFSTSDVFDVEADQSWRDDFFNLVLKTPNIDWLILTKRVGNVKKMVPRDWLVNGFPANVWLGITVVTQGEAERDIPKLMALPASVRFLSMEPLLGMVQLDAVRYEHMPGVVGDALNPPTDYDQASGGRYPAIDWVICGGEAAAKARPMHPDWARSLRDQCVQAGTHFFFKQWGNWCPESSDIIQSTRKKIVINNSGEITSEADPTAEVMVRMRKQDAGELLDGRMHQNIPGYSNNN